MFSHGCGRYSAEAILVGDLEFLIAIQQPGLELSMSQPLELTNLPPKSGHKVEGIEWRCDCMICIHDPNKQSN